MANKKDIIWCKEILDPDLFSSSPPEIRVMIISQSIDLVRIFSQVDNEYKSILEREYYNQMGDMLVSRTEREYVLDCQPFTVEVCIMPNFNPFSINYLMSISWMRRLKKLRIYFWLCQEHICRW